MLSGGGQITKRPHLLSKDGKLLLVCVANTIRAYSAATAELLFSLSRHTDEVTGLALHPSNPNQFYSCSLDGTILQWELDSDVPVRTYHINEPVESIAISSGAAYVSCYWRDRNAGRILRQPLSSGVPAEPYRSKVSEPRPLAACSSLIATFDRHSVLVWTSDTFSNGPQVLHHTKAITCIAVSPDGERVAAGDITGRILIWHNVLSTLRGGSKGTDTSQADPPVTTVHWHAHAVGCLTFSEDGLYVLSGGQEAVLVVWDAATGKRTYLPRLGGPLVGLATCPSDYAMYAIRQNDNTLRIINAAGMRVEMSLHGVRPRPKGQYAPLAVHPHTGHIVFAGPHALLQWYDVVHDSHVDKLQLTHRNLGTLTESDASALGGAYGAPAEPAIIEFCFTKSGSVLVTVETRPSAGALGSIAHTLKFWNKNPAAGYGAPYVLNTLVDQPHSENIGTLVTGLVCHPTENKAVTLSSVGEFKVWSRKRMAERETTWRCRWVGKYKAEPMGAAAFSSDGSLLAVASGSNVTLWDAHAAELIAALEAPGADDARAHVITHMHFIVDTPYVVTGSEGALVVYNVLTKSVEWAVGLCVLGLAVDPASDHFVVVVPHAGSSTAVLAFNRKTSKPICGWKIKRCAPSSPPQVVFLDKGLIVDGMSPVLIVTNEREYVCVGELEHTPLPFQRKKLDSFAPSAYETMYGKHESSSNNNNNNNTNTNSSKAEIVRTVPPASVERLFDAPSHALPPMHILCPSFLELMLK